VIDPIEVESWFKVYLEEGLKCASPSEKPAVPAWAHSMSLIAEQFVDNDESDPVEQPEFA
jgi:hypothetical protein